MKILHSWLNEFADFGNDVDAIAASLTKLGLAVESVEQVGLPVKGVVVAKVLRTERHPDAAKVHRVYVDAGDGVEKHVWCGAFNMKPGDLIPLATTSFDKSNPALFNPRKAWSAASPSKFATPTLPETNLSVN